MSVATVRVVSVVGWERIHKWKKVRRVKVAFYFPKRGRERARCGDRRQQQPPRVRLWGFTG